MNYNIDENDTKTELNDLRQKISLLKESFKVKRNISEKKNWSSQATEISNLADVFGAKRIIHDCIVELTLANNFLDGNEQTAAIGSQKLQRFDNGKDCENVTIAIEGFSIARVNPVARGENLVDDSDIGASENFFNEHKKEAAMQTEASDISTDRDITESHANPRTTDETDKKTSQWHRMKKRKWFSFCCTKREKKSNEKIE